MTTAFEPIGDTSRAVQFLEFAEGYDYGDVMKYGDLEHHPGLDRRGVQAVVNTAVRRLEKTQLKTVEAVTNEGYRIVDPAEHFSRASHYQRKSRRALVRAKSKVQHVDKSKLTPEQRRQADDSVVTLGALADFARQCDIRYAKRVEVEQLVMKQNAHEVRTDDELTAMRERMARLEKLVKRDNGTE